jgi:hypothetical protein
MIWSQVLGVFPQECNSEGAVFRNAPSHRRIDQKISVFDESPIEQAHHTSHVYTRLFSNITNWFNRQEAIQNRRHMGDVPDVHGARRRLEHK